MDLIGKSVKNCIICGANAQGVNFNALTCNSCKVFFRRNALRYKDFNCILDNSCEVNMTTRKFCTKCRLKKCFDCGMQKEKIQSDIEKQRSNERIRKKNRRAKQKMKTYENDLKTIKLDELKNSKSLSFSNNDDSLENDNLSLSPSLEEYCDSILNKDSCSLNIDDLALTNQEEYEVEIEEGHQLDFCELTELSSSPLISQSFANNRELIQPEKFLLNELLNACTVLQNPYRRFRELHHCDHEHPNQITQYFFHRLIRMCKRLSRFCLLSQEDQTQMLKHNLIDMFSLRTVLMYIPDRETWSLVDDKCRVSLMVNLEMIRPMVKADLFESNKIYYLNLLGKFRQEWLQDNVIFDLLTAIVLFKPRLGYSQYEQIKEEHHRYKTLLGRYLEMIYPSRAEAEESFRILMNNLEAVLQLNSHISYFLRNDLTKPVKNSPFFAQFMDF